MPADRAGSICARSSASAASGARCRRRLATSRQKKPSSSIRPEERLTVERKSMTPQTARPRRLEMGEVLAAEGDDVFRRGLGFGLQGHKRAGRLAPLLIWTGHDRCFEYGRMPVEDNSTSMVEMFSPPEMMMSFERSLSSNRGIPAGTGAFPNLCDNRNRQRRQRAPCAVLPRGGGGSL